MCDKLPEKMREAVQAAWLEGMTADEEFKPSLRLVKNAADVAIEVVRSAAPRLHDKSIKSEQSTLDPA
jgi:hypothetical protein